MCKCTAHTCTDARIILLCRVLCGAGDPLSWCVWCVCVCALWPVLSPTLLVCMGAASTPTAWVVHVQDPACVMSPSESVSGCELPVRETLQRLALPLLYHCMQVGGLSRATRLRCTHVPPVMLQLCWLLLAIFRDVAASRRSEVLML